MKDRDIRDVKQISSMALMADTVGYVQYFDAVPCTIYALTGSATSLSVGLFSLMLLLIL